MASLLFSPSDRTLRRTLTPDREEATSTAICRAVSEEVGEPVLELPPLGSVVDPEALEAVVSPRYGTGHVAFEYVGLVVVVSADGTISIYDGA